MCMGTCLSMCVHVVFNTRPFCFNLFGSMSGTTGSGESFICSCFVYMFVYVLLLLFCVCLYVYVCLLAFMCVLPLISLMTQVLLIFFFDLGSARSYS